MTTTEKNEISNKVKDAILSHFEAHKTWNAKKMFVYMRKTFGGSDTETRIATLRLMEAGYELDWFHREDRMYLRIKENERVKDAKGE